MNANLTYFINFGGGKYERGTFSESKVIIQENEISKSLQEFSLAATMGKVLLGGVFYKALTKVNSRLFELVLHGALDLIKHLDRAYEPPSVESIMRDFALNGHIIEDNICQYDAASMYERHTLRKIQHTGSLKEFRKTPKKITKNSGCQFCVFCENNNEPEAVVRSHAVRDALGRVLCPKLRTYTCPICGESGDKAHTIKYCPKRSIVTMEDTLVAEALRTAKLTYYKTEMKI